MDEFLPNLGSPQDKNQLVDLREIGSTGIRRFSGKQHCPFNQE